MPSHVIVDGSNLATEGRAMPSLHQLNEAVMAFIAEHPDALITVVVDATFGHRISSGEVAEFDEAVSNNELVAPPAGAIGRGDAFLLSIANKVGATVLSNDSFQEFHGTYPWLFDDGRLIGGKPVPHIGWVFVARTPVRGPISRSAVKEARRKKDSGSGGGVALPLSDRGRGRRDKRGPSVSPEASRPMPIPKAPPPNATIPGAKPPAPQKSQPAPKPDSAPARPAASAATAVNDFTSFLSFVEHHPIGTSVNAIVETYSSHGAYVKLDGGVVGYVPLRLMSDPPPRSAREFMKIGDAVTLVVESFAPARRSIDLAMTSMAKAVPPTPAKRAKKAAATTDADTAAATVDGDAVEKKPSRRRKAAPTAEPTALVTERDAASASAEAAAADAAETQVGTARKAPRATKAKKPATKDAAMDAATAPKPATAAKRTKAAARSTAADDASATPDVPAAEKPATASRARKKAAPAEALSAGAGQAVDGVAATGGSGGDPGATTAAGTDDAPAKKPARRTKKAAAAEAPPALDAAAENAATIDTAPASNGPSPAPSRRRRTPARTSD